MVLFIVVVVILFIIFSSGKSTGVSSPKRDSFYIGPPKMPPQDVNPYMRSRHNVPLQHTTCIADTDECTESIDTVTTPVVIVKDPVTATATEPEIVYKNIAKNHPEPLVYWECRHPDLPLPSPAEQLIIDELNMYRVIWDRECEFQGLQVNRWSYPRFDIVLQVPSSTGIHIIEYDGASSHNTPKQKAMDKLKTSFCTTHNIPLTRLNRKHYYNIPNEIHYIMKKYGIRKR